MKKSSLRAQTVKRTFLFFRVISQFSPMCVREEWMYLVGIV